MLDEAQVLDELYGVPPEDFTRTRNERAAQAKASGDRELAARIQQLRKPTVSAWAVNMLVRLHGDEVAGLLSLGAQLREAQATLSGNALRQLSRQRSQVVSALGRRARGMAAELGHRLSESAASEVDQTLQTALVDPAAARTVRAGRMTAPLSYTGLGPLPHADMPGVIPSAPISDAPADTPNGGPPGGRPPAEEDVAPNPALEWAAALGSGEWSTPAKRAGKTKATHPRTGPHEPAPGKTKESEQGNELARRRAEHARRQRELEEAKRALGDAERDAEEASTALREATARVDRTTARRDGLEERISRLTAQLRELEEQAMHASRDVREARHGRDSAAHADRLARRVLERAQNEVARLEES